jgi:hypothetical protein
MCGVVKEKARAQKSREKKRDRQTNDKSTLAFFFVLSIALTIDEALLHSVALLLLTYCQQQHHHPILFFYKTNNSFV